MSSIPEFCCNCAELGHVEQDCNAAAATPQSMRQGWEQYYQLLVTLHPEIANQRVPKNKCCRITATGREAVYSCLWTRTSIRKSWSLKPR